MEKTKIIVTLTGKSQTTKYLLIFFF